MQCDYLIKHEMLRVVTFMYQRHKGQSQTGPRPLVQVKADTIDIIEDTGSVLRTAFHLMVFSGLF